MKMAWMILTWMGRAALIGGLACLSVTDIRERRLPNRILLALLGIRGFLLGADILLSGGSGIPDELVFIGGGILGGLLFLPVALFLKGGIGMGDIKLYAVVGSYVGFSGILSVELLSLLLVLLFGTGKLIFRKMKAKDCIPLGPFIMAGTILVIAFV